MHSGPARKFRFDNCFDEEVEFEVELEEQEELAPPPPTFSEAELAAARTAGFVEGRTEGIAEMQSGLDRRLTLLMDDMVRQLQSLGAEQERAAGGAEAKMLALAGAIARKIVPPVARAHADAAVRDVIRDCLPKLRDEPRIVIRVHAAVLDRLREQIDAVAVRSGYPGDIILLADDELAESDCRIEWSDGGAQRSTTEIWAEIDRAMETHLAGHAIDPVAPHAATAEPEPEPETETEADRTEEKPNG
ncbi:MAG: FliH/SctL family protein [Rhodospirillaceae bacterium]